MEDRLLSWSSTGASSVQVEGLGDNGSMMQLGEAPEKGTEAQVEDDGDEGERDVECGVTGSVARACSNLGFLMGDSAKDGGMDKSNGTGRLRHDEGAGSELLRPNGVAAWLLAVTVVQLLVSRGGHRLSEEVMGVEMGVEMEDS